MAEYLPAVNMLFSAAFATLLAAATAVSAANIPVTVGANGTLTFSPSNVTAAEGDVIVFTL
jgi:plastocyanin